MVDVLYRVPLQRKEMFGKTRQEEKATCQQNKEGGGIEKGCQILLHLGQRLKSQYEVLRENPKEGQKQVRRKKTTPAENSPAAEQIKRGGDKKKSQRGTYS